MTKGRGVKKEIKIVIHLDSRLFCLEKSMMQKKPHQSALVLRVQCFLVTPEPLLISSDS